MPRRVRILLDFFSALRYNPAVVKNRVTLILLFLILALFALDQVSKWAIVLNFPFDWQYGYSAKHIPVIDGCGWVNFSLVRVHNTGVAFGTGNGTVWAPFVFLGVQVVALTWLTALYRRGFFATRLMKAAWVLLMAGVFGNMADRLTQGFFIPGAEKLSFVQNLLNGYVVDFLDFSFPWIQTEMWPTGYHWPSFNVADSCVCTAAALFILSGFLSPKEKAPAAAEKKAETPETK